MKLQKQKNNKENKNLISKYGIDLTHLAKNGKIDPVIGREKEIRRMIQILSRRNKNNPVFIGEPGTGKTTIVEGLAKRIIDMDVPENIKNKKIIRMDLTSMISGAAFKGQFEERLNNFIKEIINSEGKIILFIDELHIIVGAGNLEGQMDVANILKPELARGNIKVIGATTLNEYQKYIEKDSALERRFQPINISEPNISDTITILRGIKDKYEIHHGLHIKDNALIGAATLSDRYISDRFLPDKAIDLIDEALAQLKIEASSKPQIIEEAELKLKSLELNLISTDKTNDKEINQLESRKEIVSKDLESL